ncbi:MAG: Hin recombinase, partial [Alphaproteobacteria bacterium]|nr:Hin recombinase [Alphaproteobacteria bacterium]
RKGGRKFKMTSTKLQLAQAAMKESETKISDLCKELGITRQTLYRHLDPKGELRSGAHKLMVQKNN